MSNAVIHRLTSVAVLSFGSVGCCVLLTWAAPLLAEAATGVQEPSRDPELLVEQTVVLLAAVALVVLVSWLPTSVLVCVVTVLRNGPDDRVGLLRPRIVTALVTTALGAAVTAGGTIAQASGRPELPRAIDGLSLPDRMYGGVRTHPVATDDSMWSITAGVLPTGASARSIAEAWPRLHQLNVDRVGDDPDVLHPGTVLRLPVWASAPTRGAPR